MKCGTDHNGFGLKPVSIKNLLALVTLYIVLTYVVGCMAPIATQTIGLAGGFAPSSSNYLGGGKGESYLYRFP
jgi:hypothetical protein